MNSIKILDESNLTELDGLVNEYLEKEGFKKLEEVLNDRESFLNEIKDIKYKNNLLKFVNEDIEKVASTGEKSIVFIDGYGGIESLCINRKLLADEPMNLIESALILSALSNSDKVFLGILFDFKREISLYDELLRILRDKKFFQKIGMEMEVFPLSRDIVDGEKTSLFEYSQGRRGCPTLEEDKILLDGIDNRPTLIIDLETVLDLKMEENRNSSFVSLIGDVNKAEVIRVNFGDKFKDIVKDKTNMSILKGIYLGGPMGLPLTEEEMELTFELESLKGLGLNFIPKEITILSNDRNILNLNKRFSEYFVEKSCGKCTPCREGTTRILEIYEKILDGRAEGSDLEKLEELSETLRYTSYCKLGESAANLYLEGFKRFINDYREYVQIDMSALSGVDKDEE